MTALEVAHTLLQIVNGHGGLVAAAGGCVHTTDAIHSYVRGDSKPREVVLESAYTQEIRMIWLLTALLVVALIVSSLRIGAWYLLKYDTGNRD
jgi:uncharacterized membrane protein